MPQTLNPETLPIHIDSLRRAARGMTRSHHDAEDLVQDTLVRVLARPRQVGPGGRRSLPAPGAAQHARLDVALA